MEHPRITYKEQAEADVENNCKNSESYAAAEDLLRRIKRVRRFNAETADTIIMKTLIPGYKRKLGAPLQDVRMASINRPLRSLENNIKLNIGEPLQRIAIPMKKPRILQIQKAFPPRRVVVDDQENVAPMPAAGHNKPKMHGVILCKKQNVSMINFNAASRAEKTFKIRKLRRCLRNRTVQIQDSEIVVPSDENCPPFPSRMVQGFQKLHRPQGLLCPEIPDEILINGAVYRKSRTPADKVLYTGAGIAQNVSQMYPNPNQAAGIMQPFGPPTGALSMMPHQRFDHSRLVNGRFRHPNPQFSFRPRIPNSGSMGPNFDGMRQGPPPFIPIERQPFPFPHNPGQRHDFNNNGGRHCGPMHFRNPQRFAPYPRPEMNRRGEMPNENGHFPPAWRQPFVRPENNPMDYPFQQFSAPGMQASGPAMPDWRLNFNNGQNAKENHAQFRNGRNCASPIGTSGQNVNIGEGPGVRQQNGGFREGNAELEDYGSGTRRQNDNDGPEYDPQFSTENYDSGFGPDEDTGASNDEEHKFPANGSYEERSYAISSKNLSSLDSETQEELSRAIKLFLEKHVSSNSARPPPVAEVRDNFYYVDDFLQVSIFGSHKSVTKGGQFSVIASYGICFKKGNQLNCAGRLKANCPQTDISAALLAAERAILLAKHEVHVNQLTIITTSDEVLKNIAQWKQRMVASSNNFKPETWLEFKHVNEIRRVCEALDGMKIKWTLGDLKDTSFMELQIAKNLSTQCDDIIEDFIAP